MLIDDHADRTDEWYSYADLIVNQNLAFESSLYPQTLQDRCQSGSNYVLLRPEFWTLTHDGPNRQNNQPSSPCKLLITFGSSDPQNASFPLLKHVCKKLEKSGSLLTTKKIRIQVLIGPAFDLQQVQALLDLANQYSYVQVLQNHTQIASLFEQSDLAVTAGGTTTWELLRCGVWPLVLRIADNQDVVMDGLKRCKIGTDLGVYRHDMNQDGRMNFDWDQCINILLHTLDQWMNGGLSDPSTWVDGRGVWRVIDRIVEV